jgi:hypothetical protein
MARPILKLAQIAALPIACAMMLLLTLTNLPHIHHRLTAFLRTRMLFAGVGRVTDDGSFLMAEKSESIRSVCGIPEFSMPMFSIGQFLKPAVTVVQFSELKNSRQRIQISVGDSNMCEEAEYLRIGTTLLVIDLLESRPQTPLPQLKRPIKTLRMLSRDQNLNQQFSLKDGTQATGLEIPRRYLQACSDYVQNDRPDDEEAAHILRLWNDTLDCLETDPDRLVGRVDWVTKRFLLNEAGPSLPVSAKK